MTQSRKWQEKGRTTTYTLKCTSQSLQFNRLDLINFTKNFRKLKIEITQVTLKQPSTYSLLLSQVGHMMARPFISNWRKRTVYSILICLTNPYWGGGGGKHHTELKDTSSHPRFYSKFSLLTKQRGKSAALSQSWQSIMLLTLQKMQVLFYK